MKERRRRTDGIHAGGRNTTAAPGQAGRATQ